MLGEGSQPAWQLPRQVPPARPAVQRVSEARRPHRAARRRLELCQGQVLGDGVGRGRPHAARVPENWEHSCPCAQIGTSVCVPWQKFHVAVKSPRLQKHVQSEPSPVIFVSGKTCFEASPPRPPRHRSHYPLPECPPQFPAWPCLRGWALPHDTQPGSHLPGHPCLLHTCVQTHSQPRGPAGAMLCPL